MNKKDWERAVEKRMRSDMKEIHKLLAKSKKDLDPSLLKLAAIQLEDVSGMALMRNAARKVSAKKYLFMMDEDGDLVFKPASEVENGEAKGYV